MFFILAQICGLIALVLIVIRVQFKTKEKIVMCSVLVNIVVAIQYFLLSALTGAVISGIISWQNLWSLIPIIVTVVYTYGLWQDNVTVIRITTGIVGFGWAIYNLVVMAYIGALQETSQLISAIIALYRNRDKKVAQ